MLSPSRRSATISRRTALAVAGGVGLWASSAGAATRPGEAGDPQRPGAPFDQLPQEEKWRRRFPQPVLVSDLIGRQMLDPNQGVLGWIETVVRKPDGEILIAFARRKLLLFKGEVVAVPAQVTALLGPFVMILDLQREAIAGLPAFTPAGTSPVDRSSKIAMALTKH